ncbi:MAG: SURF1 family protein [Actinomycetes bacterium]
MYRFLLTPRWLGGLALAVALAAACVVLGTWQWDRREQARERNSPVLANYASPPVTLDDVLDDPTGEPLPRSREWTPVEASGSYRPQDTLLLRNRSLHGRPGYHVLVPLELDSGGALLVDRGWVPTGATGAGPDDVPPPPTGRVDVVARLRPPEPALDRDAPPGQVQSIHLASIAATLEDPTLATAAYAVLASEEPSPSRAPVLLPRPVIDEGPHLSYSLQWFVFALGAFVGYGFLARRTAHDLRAVAGPTPSAGRPARRRPTAEDEEDALLDAAERDGARQG